MWIPTPPLSTYFEYIFLRTLCTGTMLESSFYCNDQNIINLYVLLVTINKLGFALVSFSRFELILLTPPLVQRESSHLRVFSTNYFIFSIFNFRSCPTLILKYHRWFPHLFSWLLPFFGKSELCVQTCKNCVVSLLF